MLSEDHQLSAVKLAEKIGIVSRNIENNIKKFDIVKYISENHKKILEKDYCNLNLDIFKEIFKIIQNIKNNNTKYSNV